MTDLDAIDIRLLELIQADSSLPQSELGRRIHLSTAAVNRRLKRLVENGVVQKVAAVLDPSALGHPLTIVTEVETQSEQIELLDAMKRSFRGCPQVQQCYYVTGEWDFILIFVVRDMAQYTALTRALFFESNNVKRFRTLVTMDRIKVSLDVSLD